MYFCMDIKQVARPYLSQFPYKIKQSLHSSYYKQLCDIRPMLIYSGLLRLKTRSLIALNSNVPHAEGGKQLFAIKYQNSFPHAVLTF